MGEAALPSLLERLYKERGPQLPRRGGVINWFLYQNLLPSTLLFRLFSPEFKRPVVWRGEKGSGGQTLDEWGADVGIDERWRQH